MKRVTSLCLTLIIFLLFSCTPASPTYSFDYSSPLLDKGRIKMKIDVEFKKETGVKEMEKNIDRKRYSRQLILRSMKVREVSGNEGRRKAANSIRKALQQQLNEDIRKVGFSDYSVSGNS